ncbi:MAG: fasciclin domain-containing protein [Bacteroidales bacterium]
MKVDVSSGVKLNKTTSNKYAAADVDVKNGVIHVIDRVLLPPTVVDWFRQLSKQTSSTHSVQAVLSPSLPPRTQLSRALFTTLGISGIADLTAEQLTFPILTYHVVSYPGNVLSTQLQAGNVETLNGGSISVSLSPAPTINGSSAIVATDVQGSNGVIHVINNSVPAVRYPYMIHEKGDAHNGRRFFT